MGIWLNYSLAMWRNTSGLPRAMISYDRLLEDWEGSLQPWVETLSISMPAVGDRVARAIDGAIRINLRHTASKIGDLAKAGCPVPVCELAVVFDEIARNRDFEEVSIESKVSRLLERHLSLSALYRRDSSRKTDKALHLMSQAEEVGNAHAAQRRADEDLATKEDVVQSLRLLVNEKDLRLVELGQHLQEARKENARAQSLARERDLELSELHQRGAAQLEEITRLRGSLEETVRDVAYLRTENKELQRVVAFRDKQLIKAREATKGVAESLRDVFASQSWLVTRPLRAGYDVLRNMHRGPKAVRKAADQRRIRERKQNRWTLKRRPTVSVCILTQNHHLTIQACLNSVVPVADEVIVLDSGSTDGTLELVRGYPKVKVIHNEFKDIASQRNVYLAEATHDWILSIDADEVMGEGLGKEVPRLIRSASYSAYWFPRYWLVSVNPLQYLENEVTYPDYQLRLIRNVPGLAFYNRVHQEIEVPGGHLNLDKPHLFHLHYLLHDRSQREARLARYEQLWEGAGTGVYRKYYLFEDYPFAIHPCQEGLNLDSSVMEGVRRLKKVDLQRSVAVD